ncbi:UNVERIFIED_CONTAM: hypothetical protein DES50_1011197 [Williamsia faeni]
MESKIWPALAVTGLMPDEALVAALDRKPKSSCASCSGGRADSTLSESGSVVPVFNSGVYVIANSKVPTHTPLRMTVTNRGADPKSLVLQRDPIRDSGTRE